MAVVLLLFVRFYIVNCHSTVSYLTVIMSSMRATCWHGSAALLCRWLAKCVVVTIHSILDVGLIANTLCVARCGQGKYLMLRFCHCDEVYSILVEIFNWRIVKILKLFEMAMAFTEQKIFLIVVTRGLAFLLIISVTANRVIWAWREIFMRPFNAQ